MERAIVSTTIWRLSAKLHRRNVCVITSNTSKRTLVIGER
jgi:hypothetical protein